jgi:hypothetical protein
MDPWTSNVREPFRLRRATRNEDRTYGFGRIDPGGSGLAMAQVYPFHSTVGSDRAVHHDNTGCKEARTIPRESRRDGTGGRPKCERCEELDRADG